MELFNFLSSIEPFSLLPDPASPSSTLSRRVSPDATSRRYAKTPEQQWNMEIDMAEYIREGLLAMAEIRDSGKTIVLSDVEPTTACCLPEFAYRDDFQSPRFCEASEDNSRRDNEKNYSNPKSEVLEPVWKSLLDSFEFAGLMSEQLQDDNRFKKISVKSSDIASEIAITYQEIIVEYA
ncbi:hypothetical protein NLG97_g2557 [Lecanicillium saksenae]|uniref:Uncharacterized protein n=1 Tax=Lecanicillium saksenae TaxID=468837 RepID=A0ACC1R403_9HYPO|nr:hypothetical protein NLG97_g2557 [Lecanicillium saksenae]